MPKLIILYGHPDDPARFEEGGTQRHIPYAIEHMKASPEPGTEPLAPSTRVLRHTLEPSSSPTATWATCEPMWDPMARQ